MPRLGFTPRVMAIAVLLFFSVTARNAGAAVILDTGHYHGFYGAPLLNELFAGMRTNSVDSAEPILIVNSTDAGVTVPHVLAASLVGQNLANYSAIWFGEGFSSQVVGFEAALQTYAASGRNIGFESMFATFYTQPVDAVVGFDIDAFLTADFSCNDNGAITAAGSAFGLSSVTPIGCRSHASFNMPALAAAHGYTAFLDFSDVGRADRAEIVASLISVPEPAAILLLSAGLGAALRRRARRKSSR